ncbi:hypothetical protein OJ253_403 [Cryptosporidium canis]|uniref:Uncharacterized protein n=1 Tax=Cryptosporidium canis TaxID=195482 RepID=A0A9D5DJT2_9CRYT|nr:hypothetical protein OJ253_403 [Cryptosporidium canis]
MGISDASENTLRIIKAANRSLQFHQDRLGRASTTAEQKAPPRRDSSSSRPIEAHTLGQVPRHLKLEPESLRDGECDRPESIQGAQEKIRELEDRISKILEYSSVLEETLKQNIDMSNSARSPHRCCSCSNNSYYSGRDCSRELDKPRITGMLRDLVLMVSRKKARQAKAKAKAKAKAQTQALSESRHGQAPGYTSQMPESLVEYLSRSILERCIDDILASIDTAIHEFSVKFVQQEQLETETIP